MRFSIDLEHKIISYTPDFPKGHLKALEKIYLSQGYKIQQVVSIFVVNDSDLKAEKEVNLPSFRPAPLNADMHKKLYEQNKHNSF
jgi:hypothetical protein